MTTGRDGRGHVEGTCRREDGGQECTNILAGRVLGGVCVVG